MRIEPVFLLEQPPSRPGFTRRSLLAIGGGATLTGLGLGWLLRGDAAAPSPADPDLAWAIALANGPDDKLVANYRHFVFLAWTRSPVEDVFWSGLERLAGIVLSERAPERAQTRQIAADLVQTFDSYSPPDSLRSLTPRLRALLR
jgi:hypothetical protein